MEYVGERCRLQISGTMAEVLFNWTVITSFICEDFDIPPEELGQALPSFLKDYRENMLKSMTKFDLAAMRKEKEGS